jgi:GxxExxY protein
MALQGIAFQRRFQFALNYKGHTITEGRLDFLVEGCLIVELKAVDALAAIHTVQVVSYLKATGHHLGLLLNFNVPTMSAGLKRVIL